MSFLRADHEAQRGERINQAPPYEQFLAHPPTWMAQGECGGDNAELMERAFKYRQHTKGIAGRVLNAAKEVCAGCPVREACLEFQLQMEAPVDADVLGVQYRYGMFGGLSPRERYDLAVERLEASA